MESASKPVDAGCMRLPLVIAREALSERRLVCGFILQDADFHFDISSCHPLGVSPGAGEDVYWCWVHSPLLAEQAPSRGPAPITAPPLLREWPSPRRHGASETPAPAVA